MFTITKLSPFYEWKRMSVMVVYISEQPWHINLRAIFLKNFIANRYLLISILNGI